MTALLDQPTTKHRRSADLECRPILVADGDPCVLGNKPVGVLPGNAPAIVDLVDVTACSGHCWHSSGQYVAARIEGQTTRLHRFLCKTDADVIDHRSGNRYDNRRCNLRTGTFEDNRANVPNSQTRTELIAEAKQLAAIAPLPCLQDTDDELRIVVVVDPGAIDRETFRGLYGDTITTLLDLNHPVLIGSPTDGPFLNAIEPDAVLVIAPSWSFQAFALDTITKEPDLDCDEICQLLRRHRQWVDTLSDLDTCGAIFRPGPVVSHLARREVADALAQLVLALAVGCQTDGELLYAHDCEGTSE